VSLAGTFSSTSGKDTVFSNGTWYYVVTAVNASGESAISNCQSAIVKIHLPRTPFLNVPTPNPSTNGTLFLSWTASSGATSYKLYRYTSTITTINASVVLAGTFATTSGSDTVRKSGKWYYVVTAVNASGASGISNCQYGVIAIPPGPPSLISITPNPSTNGTLFLSWTASSGATSYKLYRYTSMITTLNRSLVLVDTFSSTSGKDTVFVNGTWYYVVTAVNASGESAMSNCVNGVVAIPPASPQPPYALIAIIVIVIIGICTIAVIAARRKHVTKNRLKPKVPVTSQILTLSLSEIPPGTANRTELQPSTNAPVIILESILSGSRAAWNPFEIASVLGFKENPELFYKFLSTVNEERARLEPGSSELLRFESDQVVLNLAMSNEEKTWFVERFQQFLNA